MNNVSLHVISESDFSAMRTEWNALLSSTRNNSVFLTWEWLFSWWQHFKMANHTLGVVCARDGTGNLKGILPLYHELDGQQEDGGTLRFLGTGEACSDFLDMIVEEGLEAEIIPRLINYSLDKWRSSAVRLTDIPVGSKNLSFIESVLQERKISYSLRDGEICPFIALPETLEGFMKKLKPNIRSNYKYSLNRINKRLGKIKVMVESKEGFQSDLDTLFILHRARFEMKGEPSGFLSEKMMKFHMDVGKMFKDQGWTRFYTIESEDKVVGSLYCFVYGGRTYYYQGGFDPKYDFLSVGLGLLGKVMEDSIENGIKMFEFLRGAEPYKWHWTNTYRKTTHIIAYPKNLLGTTKYRYDSMRLVACDKLKVMIGRSIDSGIDGKQLVHFSDRSAE
jgi:CelD/BcsL family acetyltransferase involved in cellulose biosynthesis